MAALFGLVILVGCASSRSAPPRGSYIDPWATGVGQTPPPSPTDSIEAKVAKAKALDMAERADSPCLDSLYVALKARPLDQMSEREYQYFTEHDRACSEYRKEMAQSDRTAQTVDRAVAVWATIIILGLVGGAVALVTAGN